MSKSVQKRIAVITNQLRRDRRKGLDEEDCEHYLNKLNEIKDELEDSEHNWVSDLDELEVEEDAVEEPEEDLDDEDEEDDEYEPTYDNTAKEILEQFKVIQEQLIDEVPKKVEEAPLPAQENHYHLTENDSHDSHTHEAKGTVVKDTFWGIALLHKIGGTKLVLVGSVIVIAILWVIFR